MIWAILFGLFLGLAIAWPLGIAYGVRREQDRLAMLALRRLRSERNEGRG